MRKLIVALFASGLILVGLTGVSSAAPKESKDNGANTTGDFTPTNPKTTDPSNDHGNRPSDGSVGNADGKNPPGQSKNDKNNGYECDGNNGVGKGNPAHSACAPTTTVKGNTTTTVKDKTPPTTVKDKTPPTTVKVPTETEKKAAAAAAFEKRAAELKAAQAGTITLSGPVTAVEDAPVEGLARTGLNDWLVPIGSLFVLVGIALTGLSKVRLVPARSAS